MTKGIIQSDCEGGLGEKESWGDSIIVTFTMDYNTIEDSPRESSKDQRNHSSMEMITFISFCFPFFSHFQMFPEEGRAFLLLLNESF